MPEDFDPYHKWLGIPPKDQPPNHYRLLGLDLFESDPDVIDVAAGKQVAYLQGCATGPHVSLSQKLLNEISAARLCLLSKDSKADYDVALKAEMAQSRTATPEGQPPSLIPESVPQRSGASRTDYRPHRKRRSWPLFAAIATGVILGAGLLSVFSPGRDSEPKEQSAGIKQPTTPLKAVKLPTKSSEPKATSRPDNPPTNEPAEHDSPEHGLSPTKSKDPSDAGTATTDKPTIDEPEEPVPDNPTTTVEPEPVASDATPVTDSPTLLEEQELFDNVFAAARTPEQYQVVARDGWKLLQKAEAAGDKEMVLKEAPKVISAAREANDNETAKKATMLFIKTGDAASESDQ